MRIKPYYPVTITIDGEEVALRIKRMTLEEWAEFDGAFQRVSTPTVVRFVVRAAEGQEQERNDNGEYAIPFETIVRRRLDEMTPERRAEFEAAKAADEGDAQTFLRDAFERFVTVERGVTEEVSDGSERSVTTGLDFLRVFGARTDVLQQVLLLVRAENTIDARQKKDFRSRFVSSPGSIARSPGRAGRRRGTTAAPVATADSVATAAAVTTTTDRLSGSTGPLRPPAAPSVN